MKVINSVVIIYSFGFTGYRQRHKVLNCGTGKCDGKRLLDILWNSHGAPVIEQSAAFPEMEMECRDLCLAVLIGVTESPLYNSVLQTFFQFP